MVILSQTSAKDLNLPLCMAVLKTGKGDAKPGCPCLNPNDNKKLTQADRLQAPQITEHLVSAVVKRLEMGQPIRRRLPSNGHLHIDRQLPFLLIYRRPAKGADPAMEQLLRGESSYLIVDGHRRFNSGVVALVEAIATSLAESFGGFLLIEIWSAQAPQFDEISPPFRPAFGILAQRGDAQSSTELAVKTAPDHTADSQKARLPRPWPRHQAGVPEPGKRRRVSDDPPASAPQSGTSISPCRLRLHPRPDHPASSPFPCTGTAQSGQPGMGCGPGAG